MSIDTQKYIENISNIITVIDWGLVIAIVALIFTAISLYVQRKHNVLTVKPIAIISVADYVDKIGVYLQNKGTGPLIISRLSFIDASKRVENSLICYFETMNINIIWSTFVECIDGWAILPGESKTLIEINGDPNNSQFRKNRNIIRNVLANIKVSLLYKDIYDNVQPVKNRMLDFFAREYEESKKNNSAQHAAKPDASTGGKKTRRRVAVPSRPKRRIVVK